MYSHKFVNQGFTTISMACKYCGEKETDDARHSECPKHPAAIRCIPKPNSDCNWSRALGKKPNNEKSLPDIDHDFFALDDPPDLGVPVMGADPQQVCLRPLNEQELDNLLNSIPTYIDPDDFKTKKMTLDEWQEFFLGKTKPQTLATSLGPVTIDFNHLDCIATPVGPVSLVNIPADHYRAAIESFYRRAMPRLFPVGTIFQFNTKEVAEALNKYYSEFFWDSTLNEGEEP